ncbi:MAG: ATP-binding cassette domain-containing protein [Geminicoccaceae bacterium]|nr:ATP-binding cassette domain-containing protein [Geminicoccaceae bacterium]MCS7266979.1 ATP-binding cassette domain-containing protein [Geminicoccaceae bacterium]MCX7628795.1 ATP-binding cassette domain-containing protein [Geminicoccaceae bacterium]MDW8123400.1 ATP-binding cassette domain-containing protein [Geminicoccaceae bacterium]MDW8341654.1 ATP-binding cassette domain-containing protein [Geminicoccaceae bacterium]
MDDDRGQATILQLLGVGMRYGSGEEVLRDIDLSINAGSFHYLVGPSGAGKTSLLRVLSLSRPIARGKLVVFGHDVRELDRDRLGRLRRRIGVVFQDFRLLDHLSVFDNVALPLRIGGADEERIAAHVSQMLAWLGLADFMEAKPPALSMGQRQLVAIARAVITRPDLLLADEPTSNVDPARAERLMYLFTELHKLGTAVILATHSREHLRRWPFPVLRMEGGRLLSPPASERLAAE